MKTVKIICGGGSYTRNGRPAAAYRGDQVSVEDAEAVLLAGAGAARIIDESGAPESPAAGGQKAPVSGPAPETDTAPPDGGDAPDGGGSGQDGPDGGASDGGASDGVAIPDTVSIVDGHFVRDSLLTLERKDMEALAADLGVDVSKCRNKGAIADLLAAVELGGTEEDNEAPPDLGLEDLVV